ncbi:hypothetical protein M3Y99_00669000 [Aphelenchoides fujianensis]|nr:hypothetical protein M3Y99_00669000 [Aphelenchoides fujianensis]
MVGDRSEKSTSSSPSTVVVVGSGSRGAPQQCTICGDFAYSRHFRVVSCRAWCSRNHECDIRAGRNARHLCKFCRFMNVQMGMEISAIVEREPEEFRSFSVESPVRKVLIAQRATFVNRYAAQLRACAGNHALVRMGCENRRLANMVTVAAEFPVLLDFLVASGIEDCGLERRQTMLLAKELFYTWISYQSIMATMKNSGHKLNLSYFIDESFVKASDEVVQDFVQTCPGLLDYNLAARATLTCCNENITSAARLHRLRMDDVEHACMFQIYALTTAVRLFPERRELRATLDQIFDQLQEHYLRNYEDVATRLGSIILMTSHLRHWSDFLQEYVTVLQLNGYDPILAKLKDGEASQTSAVDVKKESD